MSGFRLSPRRWVRTVICGSNDWRLTSLFSTIRHPIGDVGGYEAQTGKGNAHVNPNRDRQHGRIYRLLWEGSKAPDYRIAGIGLSSALVSVLENDNMFWRLTAQRLLLEARATEVVELLRKKVAGESVASLHALWILHGLGKLDREIHQAALLSASPELRRNAIRALGNSGEDLQLLLDTAAITAEDLGTS